ncbi:MAG: hypothetical protein QOH18_1907 [Solirubrobacterales bacterium]|nr:hypothetical protein [Solirubrobacterales bacterium]
MRRGLRESGLVRVLMLAWIPVVFALAGVGAAAVYSSSQPVLYEARSDVVVSPGTKFLDPGIADSFPRIATTVQQIALTQVVLQDARKRLAQRQVAVPSLDWLRSHLRLTISGDTPVLSISGVAGDVQIAIQIAWAETDALTHAIAVASAADAGADSLTDPAAEPTTTSSASTRGITLTIFSRGENRGKIQPKPTRNAVLGGNAGLLLGCLVIALLVSSPRRRDEA